jgi:hypothetical protein
VRWQPMVPAEYRGAHTSCAAAGEHEAGSDEGELTVETLQASLNAIEAINDEAQSDPSKPTSFTS